MSKQNILIGGGILTAIVIIVLVLLYNNETAKSAVTTQGAPFDAVAAYKAAIAANAQTSSEQLAANLNNALNSGNGGNNGSNLPPNSIPGVTKTIADTNDNYLIWSAGGIAYLEKYGNQTVAGKLTDQLNAAVNNTGDVGTHFAFRYHNDNVPYYNRALPDMTVYNAPISAPVAFNSGTLNNGVSLISATAEPITPELCFYNTFNVISQVSKNNVQANTFGQAIGSRQSIINSINNNLLRVESDINQIPSYAAEVIQVFVFSEVNQWPVNFGGQHTTGSQTNLIIGVVLQVAGAVLIATGVGSGVGAAVVTIGTGVEKIPG